jgi:hypothetical protein
MAYNRDDYRNRGGGNNNSNRAQDDIEFITLEQFTPILKGKGGRIFFELNKAVNHTRREEYVFIKLTDQFQAKDGSWKYTGKNPSIRVEMLPELKAAIEEVIAFIDQGGRSGHRSSAPAGREDSKISGLRNKLSNKGKEQPAPEKDPYSGDEPDPF